MKTPRQWRGSKKAKPMRVTKRLRLCKIRADLPDRKRIHNRRDIIMQEQNNIINSLAHTKWNCKQHIVFAPKYRRKVFYEEKRMEIREILRKLCQWKGVEVIEGEICPDHIHMLVSIPPKMSVAGFMGYLKGKSSLMIYQKWGKLRPQQNKKMGEMSW